MRSLNTLYLAIILARQQHHGGSCFRYPAAPAFVTPRAVASSNRVVVAASAGALLQLSSSSSGADKSSDETSLLEAEEAAAVDAHDVSDPGIEGASMERAVMMAAELCERRAKDDHPPHQPRRPKSSSSLFGSIWSYFRRDGEDEIEVVKDAEAKYAHDLADLAAIEHANEITSLEDDTTDENARSSLFGSIHEFFHLFQKRKVEDENELIELRDAEANFAHTLSDVAALEHANEIFNVDRT